MDDSGDSMAGLFIGLLFITAFLVGFGWVIRWVYTDSEKHQISVFNSKPYSNEDPKIWAFICFICMALAVPYYFYRRKTVLALKAPANTNIPNGIEEQLKVISDMKTKNLITESEYEQKRKQVLDL